MLKIFTSNTGNNAAHLVMEQLKKNNLSGSNHIVIVPDRFAMSVEKEIFEYLGLEGAFNIDVVSFTRLAIKNLEGKDKQCLTKEGGVVLMSAVLLQEKDNLKFYRRLVGKRELAKDLYAVIASLRSSRITPQRIREVFASKASNLKDKYEDVAHIIEVYEEKLETIKGDSLTRLNRFEEKILTSETIKGSDVYVMGFDAFKGNEYDIISKLARTAKSVNIALNIGEDGAYNSHLFSIKEVKKLARELGGEVVRETRPLKEEIAEVYRNVFSFSEKKLPPSTHVRLHKEPTTYDEVKGIALEILSLIRQGYRYIDVAVVVHDDSLKPIIEDIFTRLNIPLYVDKKYALKDTLVARLVDTALNTLTSGIERDKLLAFAKNPLLGIPYEDIENLNDYILRHNLNYQYLENTTFVEADVEATRRLILDKLPKVKGTFKVREGVEVVRSLYEDIDEKVYLSLYGTDGVYPNKIVENINRRAATLLDQELDEFCNLIGDEVVTLEDFYQMIKGGIESVEISLIPNVIDAVFVGTNSDSRFFDKKVIFIAGAVDGVMPISPSYHAIMPERDVAIMEQNDLYVYPTPLETIRRDKGGLAELLTTATDRVYVSYAQFSVSGAKQNAGELFKQLEYMFGYAGEGKKKKIGSLSQKYRENNAESLGNVNNAYYEYLRKRHQEGVSSEYLTALKDYLEKEGYPVEEKVSGEVRLEVPLSFYLSNRDGRYDVYPTQIEQFYKCPYRHFLKYGLSLKEQEKGDADARIIGIFLHEVLEKFFVATKNKLKSMTDEEVKALAEKIADEVASSDDYAHLNNDPKNQKLLSDVKKEGVENILRMIPQIKTSSFTPTFFEYKFVDGDLGVKIDGQDVRIKGTVDRVDVCDDKFFVVDYKTGSVRDKDKTNRLYYGTNLQLYLYISALRDIDGKTPVGAFYLSVSSGYEKDGDNVSRFVGKISTDEEVLRLMDNGLAFDGNKVVTTALPSTLTVSKNGIDAKKNAGFSKEDFVFAADYAKKMVKQALEYMLEGYVAKHPIGGSCDYCEYKALCKDAKVRKEHSQNIEGGAFKGGNSNG